MIPTPFRQYSTVVPQEWIDINNHMNARFYTIVIYNAHSLFSQFIGFTDFGQSRWLNVIPVLNTATIIRQALMGKFDAINIGITVGIGIVLAAIGLYFAIRMFNQEKVLVRV